MLTLIILTLSFAGCEKSKTKLTITNSTTESAYTWSHGTVDLKWDVHVVVNGVDFGVIKYGESVEMEIRGKTMLIEKFNLDSCLNSTVYYKTNAGRWCYKNDESKRLLFKETQPKIPSLNGKYSWEMGYGSEPTD